MIASESVEIISLIERIASSFAGIGMSTTFGSQFVSKIEIIGIPNLRHSAIAVLSRFGSTTMTISGICFISRSPPRFCRNLSCLRLNEAASLRRKHDKLRQNLGGLREMTQIPDIVIIVDPKRESTAVAECRKLGIPIISILDTNCDPNVVDIPIPANDDAIRSIKLIISTLSDAITLGQKGP